MVGREHLEMLKINQASVPAHKAVSVAFSRHALKVHILTVSDETKAEYFHLK